MSKVKGSKQYAMVVVPYRPGRTVTRWLLALLAVALLIAASYRLGAWQAGRQLAELRDQHQQLQAAFAALEVEHQSTRQQLTNVQLGAEIDQQANEEVRQEVLALKSEIAALEEDISFYRGLMAPTADKRGLSFGNINIVATTQPRRYAFNLVVQQFASNHTLINGYMNVTVVGYQAGEPRRIPLKQLSAAIDEDDIKLRFKYFQTVQGELDLPEGFVPERLELLAVATGRNAGRVEQKYGWLVQES